MTVVELVNLALLKIGISQSITTITDGSREAFAANQVYDTTLRACLRRWAWPFATKYAALYLTRGPFWNVDPAVLILVEAWSSTYVYEVGDVARRLSVNYTCIAAHTNQQPPNATYWSTAASAMLAEANGDWLYAYRYPADCLFARRIVPPGGNARVYNETPIEFRQHRDDNGLLIATNQEDAVLEYTMLDCTNLWTDDLFLAYFTWSLAGALSPALERAQKKPVECLQMAEATIAIAATVAMQEGQQHKPDGPDWLLHR